jgi:hypothetical protein
MCVLNAENKIDLVHALSTQPTVECNICLAKAKAAENVCDPRELPDIAWMGDGADMVDTKQTESWTPHPKGPQEEK